MSEVQVSVAESVAAVAVAKLDNVIQLADLKKHTPQHIIDKFWARFTTKNPGKGKIACVSRSGVR